MEASLTTWAAPPGAAGNDTFRVRVRQGDGPWRELFTYNVKVGVWQQDGPFDSSMVHFDFTGVATVEVTHDGPIESYEFRPASFGISARRVGDTLTFDLTQDHEFPRKFVLRVNDSWDVGCLHIFTNPPQRDAPKPADVDHYFGPGEIHEVGELDISGATGKRIYIAGGAIVRGNIRAHRVRDVQIFGRGILEGTIRSAGQGRRITVDGFIILSCAWTLIFDRELKGEGQGSSEVTITNLGIITHAPRPRSCPDGVHFDAAVDCRCRGCFIRGGDDLLSVDARYGRVDLGRIVFENLVLWADRAHCMLVGYKGTPADKATVYDVTFRNIDVINNRSDVGGMAAVMQIYVTDNLTVRDITFEDIRIMAFQNPERCQLFSIDMRMNHWSEPVNGLAVRNITYRRVQYDGDGEAPSELIGKSPRRCIDGVHLIDWTRRGEPVVTAADANLLPNAYVHHLAVGRTAPPAARYDFAPPEDLREPIPYSAAARTAEPPALNFLAPQTVRVGEPFTVTDIRAMGGVATGGMLRHRPANGGPLVDAPLAATGEGLFSAVIDGSHTAGPLHWWIELKCDDGPARRAPAGEGFFELRPDAQPPTAVTGLAVFKRTGRGVTLRWRPADDDTRIAGYAMLARDEGGGESVIAELPPEERTFTWGGVTRGGRVELGVQARDSVGRVGPTAWTTADIPAEAVAPPQPNVHLSDLEPLEATTGWGRIHRDMNGVREPGPLRMRGVTYRKGLGVHADSHFVFAIEPSYRRFVAKVGMDDAQVGSARILARVRVDDRLLDQSPMLGKDDEPWAIDLALPPGARRLRIEVTDGYDQVPYGVTDWVDAGFVTA